MSDSNFASVSAFLSELADRLEKKPSFSPDEAKKLAHDCRNQAQVASLMSEVGKLPATTKKQK